MKRLLSIFATAGALLAFMAGSASAYPLVVEGGSPAQREAVVRVIDSCYLSPDWVTDRIGGVHVEIGPCADFAPRVAATSAPNAIRIKVAFDNLREGDRHVSYAWGEAGLLFQDIVAHEWAHQVWAAMSDRAREIWPLDQEDFAENFRLAMYPPELLWRTYSVRDGMLPNWAIWMYMHLIARGVI